MKPVRQFRTRGTVRHRKRICFRTVRTVYFLIRSSEVSKQYHPVLPVYLSRSTEGRGAPHRRVPPCALAFLLRLTHPVPAHLPDPSTSPASGTGERILVSASQLGGVVVRTDRSLNIKVFVLNDTKGRELAMDP